MIIRPAFAFVLATAGAFFMPAAVAGATNGRIVLSILSCRFPQAPLPTRWRG